MTDIIYNSNYSVSAKCKAEELKGRFVATKCLEDIFSPYTFTSTGTTNPYCPIDLNCTVSSTDKLHKINVEVKQRNKTEEQLVKYPTAELRVSKYQRMLTETPNDTALLYIVLLNQEWCYVFNMKKIDMESLTVMNWRIKQTQVDPNSPYVIEPTYLIPFDLAVKKVPCSEYFKEYQTQLNGTWQQ